MQEGLKETQQSSTYLQTIDLAAPRAGTVPWAARRNDAALLRVELLCDRSVVESLLPVMWNTSHQAAPSPHKDVLEVKLIAIWDQLKTRDLDFDEQIWDLAIAPPGEMTLSTTSIAVWCTREEWGDGDCGVGAVQSARGME